MVTRSDFALDPAGRARLLTGAKTTHRHITAAGIGTAVLECGDGPPVVLLHGPAEFAAGWGEVIAGLATSHRVVAPDLPGHGDSADGTVPDEPTMSALLDEPTMLTWLDDVINVTCPSRPVLVGRVLGGAIAARFAAAHPERVERIVLVDTMGLSAFEPAPPFGEALHQYLAEPSPATFDRLMLYCAYDIDAVRDRLDERYDVLAAYAVDRAQNSGVVAAAGALMAMLGGPIPESVLAGMETPTTLIWGRHDMATPLSVAEAACRRYGWPLRVIDDAADDPALDQPAAFMTVLEEVLR